MVTSKSQAISAREIRLIFTACAFLVHLWEIYNLLHEVPGLLIRLNLRDFLGVIAYTQAFALFESLIVTGFLLVVLSLLPIAVIADHRVSLATAVVLIHTILAIVVHYKYEVIQTMGTLQFLLWVILYLVSFLLVTIAVLRLEKLEKAVLAFLERMEVLIYIYVFLDLIGIGIVIARNL